MVSRPTRRLFLALASALLMVSTMSSAVFADRRDFNINNNSDYVLLRAYVSPTEAEDWGEDIMGRDVLMPGETWMIGFDRFDPATCIWDVKVVTQDEVEVKLMALDLCVITDVNITN